MLISIYNSLQTLFPRKCLQACVMVIVAWIVPHCNLFASDCLVLSAVRLYPEQTNEVKIQLNNEATYTAYQLDITLPEGVELVSTEGVNGISLTERASNSHSLSVSDMGNRVFRVVVFSSVNDVFSGNSGDLLKLSLKATGEIEDSATIKLSNILFTTTAIREVRFADVIASCMLQNFLVGDANDDGFVDALDFNIIANHILGYSQSAFNQRAADINSDGEIDAIDFNMIANIILYGNSAGANNDPEAM